MRINSILFFITWLISYILIFVYGFSSNNPFSRSFRLKERFYNNFIVKGSSCNLMLYGAKTSTFTPSILEVVNVILFAPYNMRLHDNPLTTLKNCHPYYLYDENSASNYLDDSIRDLNYKLNSQGGQLNIIKGSSTDDIILKFIEQLRNIESVHVNFMLSPIQPNKNLIDMLNRALTKEKIPYTIFNNSLLQEPIDLPSFDNVFNPKLKQLYESTGKYILRFKSIAIDYY